MFHIYIIMPSNNNSGLIQLYSKNAHSYGIFSNSKQLNSVRQIILLFFSQVKHPFDFDLQFFLYGIY